MKDIEIRFGNHSDLNEIIEIYNECIDDENPSVAYESKLDSNHPPDWLIEKVNNQSLIIEKSNNEIRGFAHIGEFILAPEISEFCQLGVYVKRIHRKSLIGARLLLGVIKVASSSGKDKIFSFVLESNTASLRATKRVLNFLGVLPAVAFIRNAHCGIHIFERNLKQGFNQEEVHFFEKHINTYFHTGVL
ncbi:GNAT family N-acetyltransferase [Leptospira sp. 201903075]|uniref:GNAT family N-acetyltransferase n=1 Tax=Leptospira chreensis TaxID=2810035 RepID=UPI0019624571|nr:GNAT family N-acetyltransferase [Leptospira chreensis]MBM9591694.1 GNAT family N-acetyltransferase [Leptospira chreensis]